jgi:hypothetical protein
MKPVQAMRQSDRKTMNTLPRTLLAAALLAMVAGCADTPLFDKKPARNPGHPKAASASERDTTPRTKERSRDRDDAPKDAAGALREGVALYNEGDYNGAIKRLSARELNSGPLATRLSALKYTAFSYCLTSRPGPCRQAFDKALRLDPSFDLAPGEHGHPLWGPVFTQAKQAAESR